MNNERYRNKKKYNTNRRKPSFTENSQNVNLFKPALNKIMTTRKNA